MTLQLPNLGSELLPPLPGIVSEIARNQCLTHRSYHARPAREFEDRPEDPSPDNESLEHLGDAVLQLVVTELVRKCYPHLHVGPATRVRSLVVGNVTLANISVNYRLHYKLKVHAVQAITLRASAKIQADAYIGALYVDQGMPAVQEWLHAVFEPYVREAYRIVKGGQVLDSLDHPSNPSTPTKSGSSVPVPLSPPRSPPRGPAPAPAVPSDASRALYEAMGHLSLFNQCLQQRGKTPEWVFIADPTSSPSVSSTRGGWTVKAMVDEKCIGSGHGATKKAAKNAAAKQGLVTLDVQV